MSQTEKAILALTLEDPSLFHRARSLGLTGKHFGSIQNRLIWSAAEEMVREQIPIDLITMRDFLTQKRSIDKVGGITYLSTLDLELPDPGHLPAYVDAVKALAVERVVSDVGKRFQRIPETGLSTDQILEAVQSGVRDIIVTSEGTMRVTRMDSAVNTLVEMLEDGIDPGLPTGYHSLDALLGGLRPGNLIIIAGRPGMGKTSLATNMMTTQAESGSEAGMFSLEMSSHELAMRMLAAKSKVPHQKIKMGALGAEEWKAIAAARASIATLPIVIEDSGGLDIDKLAAKATELRNMHNLSVIYVDYIQLMSAGAGQRSGNRVQEISDITRGLKNLARELQIPIVALSQLSRKVEERGDKRPKLADLRDSGSIEQDADAVVFVYRSGYYKRFDNTNGDTEIIVAKNRSGPPGTVNLVWDHQTSRFLNP